MRSNTIVQLSGAQRGVRFFEWEAPRRAAGNPGGLPICSRSSTPALERAGLQSARQGRGMSGNARQAVRGLGLSCMPPPGSTGYRQVGWKAPQLSRQSRAAPLSSPRRTLAREKTPLLHAAEGGKPGQCVPGPSSVLPSRRDWTGNTAKDAMGCVSCPSARRQISRWQLGKTGRSDGPLFASVGGMATSPVAQEDVCNSSGKAGAAGRTGWPGPFSCPAVPTARTSIVPAQHSGANCLRRPPFKSGRQPAATRCPVWCSLLSTPGAFFALQPGNPGRHGFRAGQISAGAALSLREESVA